MLENIYFFIFLFTQLFSTLIIMNVSCDTEDWSNDDNSALITRIKYVLKYIQKENIIFHYITVFSVFCIK